MKIVILDMTIISKKTDKLKERVKISLYRCAKARMQSSEKIRLLPNLENSKMSKSAVLYQAIYYYNQS